MKGTQIIILLTVTLLYSCSFLGLNKNIYKRHLERIFREEAKKKDSSLQNMINFFQRLDDYTENTNSLLESKLFEFELVEEEGIIRHFLEKNKESNNHKFDEVSESYKKFYDQFLKHYKVMLRFDYNESEKQNNNDGYFYYMMESFKKISKTDPKIKEQYESIENEFNSKFEKLDDETKSNLFGNEKNQDQNEIKKILMQGFFSYKKLFKSIMKDQRQKLLELLNKHI